ncbi:unnamed protein product [Paramecium primaurelia]|uniref:Uncharacterized protein n=1 Tax=Paramecium primaurelia TaxID=5886 RepID=A0A8S1LGG3_PARPR|nr:unnamed protein product [Paramecium primaurelia]CAD8065553.1 unnamed protein product [Paramecium primaurelia]
MDFVIIEMDGIKVVVAKDGEYIYTNLMGTRGFDKEYEHREYEKMNAEQEKQCAEAMKLLDEKLAQMEKFEYEEDNQVDKDDQNDKLDCQKGDVALFKNEVVQQQPPVQQKKEQIKELQQQFKLEESEEHIKQESE